MSGRASYIAFRAIEAGRRRTSRSRNQRIAGHRRCRRAADRRLQRQEDALPRSADDAEAQPGRHQVGGGCLQVPEPVGGAIGTRRDRPEDGGVAHRRATRRSTARARRRGGARKAARCPASSARSEVARKAMRRLAAASAASPRGPRDGPRIKCRRPSAAARVPRGRLPRLARSHRTAGDTASSPCEWLRRRSGSRATARPAAVETGLRAPRDSAQLSSHGCARPGIGADFRVRTARRAG